MAEHYTQNVEQDSRWCGTCGRRTQWKVMNGRLAHCLEHERQSSAASGQGPAKPKQQNLFGGVK